MSKEEQIKGFNILCDGCGICVGVLTPYGLEHAKKNKIKHTDYFCSSKCKKKKFNKK